MAPLQESAGKILLKVVSIIERHKLDSGIDRTFRMELAAEDALAVLDDPSLKLEKARNPSAMLMINAKPHLRRGKESHCAAVVPMLLLQACLLVVASAAVVV